MILQFAISYPWWILLLLAAAAVVVAWASYAGAIVALTLRRRMILTSLRALALLLLVVCVLRPVRVVPPDTASDAVVPVLVDVSRSMALPDMDGARRIDVARDLLQTQMQPALERRFRVERWTFGDGLRQTPDNTLVADARQSDLSGALRAVRERYRERHVAGIVVMSDGGDTGAAEAAAVVDEGGAPVYTIGIGASRAALDYEVLDVSAGETALADSSVDISVAAVSRGSTGGFDVRVLENGRPIDLRRMTPAADGSPVRALFTVSPARDTATLYTVEIPSAAGELVLENNRRSVLVEPPGRRRQILMIEGAPGFEHSFIKRALSADPGFEVDSIVRKGRDARGAATYFVQATEARASRLAAGFPRERGELYEYDAVLLANIEPDTLSRPQLQMLADFVDQRGGGVLVLGAKTFVQQGFAGTPLEQVLPLRLTDRGSGVVRTSARAGTRLTVTLTPDGRSHPLMRIGGSTDDLEQRWRAMPPLAGVAVLGALRPGAQALAVVSAQDGPRPLLAVQRYGQGRALLFAGEASWRWRMQLPSTDRAHEFFWRQAVRWSSTAAPDRVSVGSAGALIPGRSAAVAVAVRNEEFASVGDAGVRLHVTRPDGTTHDLPAALVDASAGRYAGDVRFDEPGVYRVRAVAQRGEAPLGAAERWMLVGGADLEMADPRLNDEVLRRVAMASGGSYLTADEAANLSSLLEAAVEPAVPQLEDLWHTLWIFLGLVLLLGTEWMLRRRWGLR
ncbi:MAG: glutamine amidotransferase [Vicinamibacterales bacterium]